MKMLRGTLSLLTAGCLAIGLVPQVSVAQEMGSGDALDTEYGPEHGLVVESGSVVLSRGNFSPNAPRYFYNGTSYVSTEEVIQLQYVGKAKSQANKVYTSNGTKRVVQARFVYRRDGVNIVDWTRSSATCNGTWRAGPLRSKSAWDSLNPWAPQTTFHYGWHMIDPNIC